MKKKCETMSLGWCVRHKKKKKGRQGTHLTGSSRASAEVGEDELLRVQTLGESSRHGCVEINNDA
jgi:hypothetical protein